MKSSINKPHINVVAGLIYKAGKVLISRRLEGSHLAGFWEFPGGKQKKDETLEECLAREIKEELGLEIRAERYLITTHHEYETKAVTLHFFCCSPLKGIPLAMEGQEIRWVFPKGLSEYRFPPPDQKVINMINTDSFPKNRKRNSNKDTITA